MPSRVIQSPHDRGQSLAIEGHLSYRNVRSEPNRRKLPIVRMHPDGPVLLTVLRTSTFGLRAAGEDLSCGRPARHGLAPGRQHPSRVRTRIKALVSGERVLPEFGRRLLRRDANGAIPSFTCRRPATPGRRARWPEIQARCDRFRCGVSNAAESEIAERRMAAVAWSAPSSRCWRLSSDVLRASCASDLTPERPRLAAGHSSRRRGAKGNPLGRETALADAVSEAGGVDVSSRGKDWAWMSGRGPDGSVAGFLQGTAEIHRLIPVTIKRSWSDHHRRIDDSHQEVAK